MEAGFFARCNTRHADNATEPCPSFPSGRTYYGTASNVHHNNAPASELELEDVLMSPCISSGIMILSPKMCGL